MGEETARLRAEIDQTRENLTRDVDLLAEKTSPSKIVERRVERTKRGISGLRERVMGTFSSDDDDERYGYGYYGDSGGSQGVTGNVRSAVSGAAARGPTAPGAASPSPVGSAGAGRARPWMEGRPVAGPAARRGSPWPCATRPVARARHW